MSGVVAAALSVASADIQAQAIPGPNPHPTNASATVLVGGPVGSFSNVFVSILGGTDRAVMTLYAFTALPANLQNPVGGQAFSPSSPLLPNNNPGTFWTAAPNSQQIGGGPFAAGSELIFGLHVQEVGFPAFWVWSGAASRNPGFPVPQLNYYGTGNVVYQNGGVLTLPGTPAGKDTYGFETDYNRNRPTTFGDYNDFVFTVSQSRIVPEPSTYALMLAGLAGMAVAARKRRRA